MPGGTAQLFEQQTLIGRSPPDYSEHGGRNAASIAYDAGPEARRVGDRPPHNNPR